MFHVWVAIKKKEYNEGRNWSILINACMNNEHVPKNELMQSITLPVYSVKGMKDELESWKC